MVLVVLRGAESETRGSSPGKWCCIDVQGRYVGELSCGRLMGSGGRTGWESV
jgi:hypothetical protein